MYDWDIRKAVIFRDANGLGDFQAFADDCSIASGFNRDGGRRSALYCIPDSDCGGDYFPAFEMNKERPSERGVDAFLLIKAAAFSVDGFRKKGIPSKIYLWYTYK